MGNEPVGEPPRREIKKTVVQEAALEKKNRFELEKKKGKKKGEMKKNK